MSRCAPPHQALTAARVLYIGRAAPTPTFEGLDAIQKPLCELYTKSERQSRRDDLESTLMALTSGVIMKPVNPLDKDLWLRIQDLESCAAVKAFHDPNGGPLMFVPTDSPAGYSSSYPSIFAVVMRRSTGGMKVSDCYAFICHSDETALVLVRAVSQAFSNPSGWSNEKPSLAELGLERPEIQVDNECYVDDARDDGAPEFYDKPSLKGFFYAPRTDLIQKYKIRGEDDYGRPIGDPPPMMSIEHFTCDDAPTQMQAPPMPIQAPAVQYALPNVYVQQPVGYAAQQVVYPDPPQQIMYAQPAPQPVSSGQQQYIIQPEQAQLYYAAAQNQVDPSQLRDYIKAQVKAEKRATKDNNRRNRQQAADSGANGGGYFVATAVQGGVPQQQQQPVYMKSLPQSDVIVTGGASTRLGGGGQNLPVRMTLQDWAAQDDRPAQQVMVTGTGDVGPQGVSYGPSVPPQGGGRGGGGSYVTEEVEVYTRRLPPRGGAAAPTDGRNFDGNFILKKSDAYRSGAVADLSGIDFGALGIADGY